MNLFDLFFKCLTIEYLQTGCKANYAFEKIGGELYIYFEGSNGVGDWLKNINFPAKPYKKMDDDVWYAHRGFIKAWKPLKPIVKKMILDKNIKKVIDRKEKRAYTSIKQIAIALKRVIFSYKDKT